VSRDAFEGIPPQAHGSILPREVPLGVRGIADKVQVRIYTEPAKVKEMLDLARKSYARRDARIEGMRDETRPRSTRARSAVVRAEPRVRVTPERTGLCGAYSWLDCKASNEIQPDGPTSRSPRGPDRRAQGPVGGRHAFVSKAPAATSPVQATHHGQPDDSCGCFECISAIAPACNGILTVDRDHAGMTRPG